MKKLLTIVIVLLISPYILASGKHALSLHGEAKYKEDFNAFDYVNANAPKGGQLVQAEIGSFDSLNPFISKGEVERNIGLIYETLAVSSSDEPFSMYGLIAKKMSIDYENNHITFEINPKAKFHDEHPIEAEDVVFSFNTLMKYGRPFYKSYYANITNVKIIDKEKVRFYWSDQDNPELPLIISQLTVLPKHYWEKKQFSKANLTPPLGSGPYKIEKLDAGRKISYLRHKNYWAKNLNVNKGKYNFDKLIFKYYRDETVALEAFKSHEYDLRRENTSKTWATQYHGKLFDRKDILKEEIKIEQPAGMQAFVFNLRKKIFQDIKIRKALNLLFDFEWTNKTIFYNAYTRTNSYFANSELASTDLPNNSEKKILLSYKDKIDPNIFTKPFQPHKTKGDGNIRTELIQAKNLFESAGWYLKNGVLKNKDGKTFHFEFLYASKNSERFLLPFSQNLKKLGIKMDLRLVDVSQYINRLRAYDYDMISFVFSQSHSPGNEQRYYWKSEFSEIDGGRNFIGLKDPVIDDLVEKLISAPTRHDLINHCRALDRVLLSGYYLIPNWYFNAERIAYWNQFSRPKIQAKHSLEIYSWWAK